MDILGVFLDFPKVIIVVRAALYTFFYLTGTVRSTTNSRWDSSGREVNNNIFNIGKNGKFSIRVTDSLGRMVITHVFLDFPKVIIVVRAALYTFFIPGLGFDIAVMLLRDGPYQH